MAVLEENLGTGWEFPTRVVFDAPLAEVAPWIRPPMGRLEPAGDGCVLVGSTSNPAMYAGEWLANVPHDFRVEDGSRAARRRGPARRAVRRRGAGYFTDVMTTSCLGAPSPLPSAVPFFARSRTTLVPAASSFPNTV